MRNNFAIELSQDIPFGILKFKLTPEEVSILKLISCEKNDAIKHWEQLWKNTEDYEHLLFSCKELMPSAVKKIQTSFVDGLWQEFIPKNAQYLAGLPRYTWTKNQYIINEYQKIAAALDKEKIEFIALKGVCEMLDGNALSFMRTSRDIDLLIHEEDWVKCRQIFENIGWVKSKNLSDSSYLNSPIKPHAETFQKSERIFDLDVHFSAISGAKSASEAFTKNLWTQKVYAKNYPTCYIPSLEDRCIIAVANAFSITNWRRGHSTKYIYDMFTLFSQIDETQLMKIKVDAERLMMLGNLVEQAINVYNNINEFKIKETKSKQYRLNISVSQTFLGLIPRLLTMMQLLKISKKGRQLIHTLTYSTSWVFLKLYNTLRRNSFSNTTGSVTKNHFKGDVKNQFSIHLFPR